ncbi:MAG: type methionyl aminopeptidase [Pseudomonadota bacterium]|jgi:methionyl aminopeptidase
MNTRPAKLPGPNDACWCGSGQKYKKCHRGEDATGTRTAAAPAAKRVMPGVVSPRRPVPAHVPPTDYFESGIPGKGAPGDPATALQRLRRACRAAAEVLQETAAALAPGVTTDFIDGVCHEAYLKRGGFPSTLNYHGFPKSLCTSVNDVILHGIPDSRPLEEGDVINLDITIYLDGMHGDCSATFAVGKTDPESERLVRVTHEAMMLGIEAVRPGARVYDIGRAIQAHADRNGFGVVREYCGHGIGHVFHRDPTIPHYFDKKFDTVLEEGMVFTVEPMLTAGSPRIRTWDDDWTVVTADGKRAAQFEHTVRVSRDGVEILTRLDAPVG